MHNNIFLNRILVLHSSLIPHLNLFQFLQNTRQFNKVLHFPKLCSSMKNCNLSVDIEIFVLIITKRFKMFMYINKYN